MNPLRYLDREALGALRTRLRWRWKAFLTRSAIASADDPVSGGLVATGVVTTLLGLATMAFGVWQVTRFEPTSGLEHVGVLAITILPLYIGWKIFRGGVVELSYVWYAGWRPPAPTDEVTLIALGEAIAAVAMLSMFVGSVGGIAGALVDVAGYDGWVARMWPWFALVACVGLPVALGVMFAGERAFGDRFMTTGEPEDAVEGVEG